MQRLLLLPLIAPLAATLIVAVANPRPGTSLRLLTWQSPALPLGAWIAGAATAGALLSGTATALALRGATPLLRRQVRRERHRGDGPAPAWTPPPAGADWRQSAEPAVPSGSRAATPPERAPGEPPPTMSVPFRVIRRPAAAAGPGHAGSGERPRHAADEPAPRGNVEDDWNQQDSSEDW
jgi:uncharacterized integral membrane protein